MLQETPEHECPKDKRPHVPTEANTTKKVKLEFPDKAYFPTKRSRRMKAIVKEVQTSILNIINKGMKAVQEKGSSGDDLLGILLESNLKEIDEQGSKNSGMNLEEVIEECKLFYFAGQETTATSLVWTLIVLSKNSDWQDRARNEIHQIFGENKPVYEGLKIGDFSQFTTSLGTKAPVKSSQSDEYDFLRGSKALSSRSDARSNDSQGYNSRGPNISCRNAAIHARNLVAS